MKTNQEYVRAVMRSSPTADLDKIKTYTWAKIQDDPVWLKSFVEAVVEREFGNICSSERERKVTGSSSEKFAAPIQASPEAAKRFAELAGKTAKDAGLRREAEANVARDKGKDRFAKNRDAIAQMRFVNGRGILDQTIAEVQAYGGWMAAILCALPKTAHVTDTLGKFLTLDQLTKIRTFNVS